MDIFRIDKNKPVKIFGKRTQPPSPLLIGGADQAQSFPVPERGVRSHNNSGHPIAFLPNLSKQWRGMISKKKLTLKLSIIKPNRQSLDRI